ncbi:MAG TPA: ROK family protein [Oscillospiraceae bacterium]|nr:ROK family protein [Oscillospiraceae bacterium]
MERYGIGIPVRNVPPLDPGFFPLGKYNEAFLRTARQPFGIAVEGTAGQVSVWETRVHGAPEMRGADLFYLERLVKTLLWMRGGWRVSLRGEETLCGEIVRAYAPKGARAFDAGFMADVYERPFEVVRCGTLPSERRSPRAVGRHLEGCRIGFDAGGSDRKVSAVVDGTPVFSEEVVWSPKTHADPAYHYDGIVSALGAAAAKLPRVDAVGVSSAGIYIGNRTMVASLFRKVPRDAFDAQVKDIYLRAAKTLGDVPVAVCNDGDVSALAGAMSLGENNILGLAMGTSEAAGFVDAGGNITGGLNELAFVPVDAGPDAPVDDWSLDTGVGAQYFSQEAVIRLAPAAGISLAPELQPAEKLLEVQRLMERGDAGAEKIYRSIGVYLGHALAFYHGFYGFRHALLLGRVMSGAGGAVVLEAAEAVLKDEYPAAAEKIVPVLPDEKARRVGQSVAAASLPEVP